MARNEAETRFYLIDPMLIDQRGWARENIRVEQTAAQIDIVYGKGQRRPAGRTDYLLCRPLTEGTEPIPLAIIEAKREDLPPEHGLQQGKGYRIGKPMPKAKLVACEEKWKAAQREAREAESKAVRIENAVYDLKAVNPNRRSVEDTRTPAEIVAEIEARGQEADAALARLKELIAASA